MVNTSAIIILVTAYLHLTKLERCISVLPVVPCYSTVTTTIILTIEIRVSTCTHYVLGFFT